MLVFSPDSASASDPVEEHIIPLYERVAPATVLLSSAYVSKHPVEAPSTSGVGSGFIWDDAGIVVTNAHVVQGATEVMATLYDGWRVKAEIIGVDPETDVAVLQLARMPNDKFAAVQLGDSDRLRVGQRALLVGSPLGLGFSLSSGIISRLGPLPLSGALSGVRLIQTTAPLNPGNSGGPMLDSDGRIIEMVTSMVIGAQNIGFAIPLSTIKGLLAELKEKGRIVRPWFGVGGKFLTEEIMRLFALPLASGLLLEDVDEGSPAAVAEMRSGALTVVVEGQHWVLGGDIVVKLDDHAVRSPEDFLRVTARLQVGQRLEVEWLQDGKQERTAVILRERPRRAVKEISSAGSHTADTLRPFFSRDVPQMVGF